MLPFHITELKASGPDQRPSVVHFQPGVNIIYGPSGSGKTTILKCIRYILCSDRIPFSAPGGYDMVEMTIRDHTGEEYRIQRKIKKNRKTGQCRPDKKISLCSIGKARRFQYKMADYEKFLLSLLSIKSPVYICKNEDGDTEALSARMIMGLFSLTVQNIGTDESLLLHPHLEVPFSVTAVLSAILLMLEGSKSGNQRQVSGRRAVRAAHEAVSSLIRKEKSTCLRQLQRLDHLLRKSPVPIENLSEEIAKAARQWEALTSFMAESAAAIQNLAIEEDETDDKLRGLYYFQHQAGSLISLYQARIEQLSFQILPGGEDIFIPLLQKIGSKDDLSSLSAEKKRLETIITDVQKERRECGMAIQRLTERKAHIQKKRDTLKKQLDGPLNWSRQDLTDHFRLYEKLLRIAQKKQDLLQEIERWKKKERQALLPGTHEKWDPAVQWEKRGFSTFSQIFTEAAAACNPENRYGTYVDFLTMDPIIRNQPKKDISYGALTFYNTLFLLTLLKYLEKHGLSRCPILTADAPITSLRESDESDQSLQSSLFRYIIDQCGDNQIIIAETKLPAGLPSDAFHLISFGPEKGNLRQGFLLDPPGTVPANTLFPENQ